MAKLLTQVAPNHRYLQFVDGSPFFWMGDTAWELVHRLTRREIQRYLETRASQGFNLIQVVALAEFDGLRVPNAEGHLPLVDCDPTQPVEAYWELLDWVFDEAASLGLIIGLLPTWGDKVVQSWGVGPVVFNEENARIYGEWIGRRYGHNDNLVWIMGGDRNVEDKKQVFVKMAEGVRAGESLRHLMTFHPQGGRTSLFDMLGEPWLDLSMFQSGHYWFGSETDLMVEKDWEKAKIPSFDGEPCYEGHLPFKAFLEEVKDFKAPRFSSLDVRRSIYSSVFAGGCGFTYGCDAVWQFYDLTREPVSHPSGTWRQSLRLPGAEQAHHLKDLMLRYSPGDRWPDQSLVIEGKGEGHLKARSMVAGDGSWGMAYLPSGRKVVLDESRFGGHPRLMLMNPRTGETEMMESDETPDSQDWVVIIER